MLSRVGAQNTSYSCLAVSWLPGNLVERRATEDPSTTARKVPAMQYKKNSRTMGRVGIFLAFVSSILVLAGPGSAAAVVVTEHEHGHEQFSVYLTGNEVRDGGDRDGWGVARLDLDPENERVCYVITWHGLDGAVTALHLHVAPRRNDGPHWIDFFNNEHFDGERNTVANCVRSSRWKIRAVIDEPFDYYLMVHTTTHEAGAIRGQLG